MERHRWEMAKQGTVGRVHVRRGENTEPAEGALPVMGVVAVDRQNDKM